MGDQFLSQTQSLKQLQVLSPQMRQSLELLQVPILELKALVEQELETNPTLEELPTDQEQIEVESMEANEENDPSEELEFNEAFDVLKKLNDDWDEYYDRANATGKVTQEDQDRRDRFFDSLTYDISLQEHLSRQLAVTGLKEEDIRLGELLIGCINDDGLLTTSLEELSESTTYSIEHIEEVLHVIQDFDPVGVAAQSYTESLLIQLQRLGHIDTLACKIVEHYLEELGQKKWPLIAQKLKVTIEDVKEAANLITSLNPRPGRIFSGGNTSYVVPEVSVEKIDGEWIVLLENDHLPRLRISRYYEKMLQNPETGKKAKAFIRKKIRNSAFLLKCIDQRQSTIRNIAEEVVRIQTPFLEEGVTALRPLTMSEIATTIGIHETTVSRAISGKYMQTPHGVFEMKYFFTPGYKNADGNMVSNTSVKEALKKVVDGESPSKPYSDQAIVEELKKQGFNLARRTVAKYREQLNILPSNLRKQY